MLYLRRCRGGIDADVHDAKPPRRSGRSGATGDLPHLGGQGDRRFPDGCFPTGWSNDLHLPDPRYNKGFEGDAFIAKAEHGVYPAHRDNRPYWVPYRCLYSRNIDNLFMAGRCISVTHEALGAVRVMRTCGTGGEIVGMAASVCKEFDTDPRGVYEKHLDSLQQRMRTGVGKVDGSTIPYSNQGATACDWSSPPPRTTFRASGKSSSTLL